MHLRSRTRPPAVAGRFYPGSADELESIVRSMLADAKAEAPSPKALIAPHAGYVFSGPIAATAYASLRERARQIRRVVLLGPAHRVALPGLALPAVERFATPLGEIAIDEELVAALEDLPQVVARADAHAYEHSLEVHLPFLQIALEPGFSLLPLVVGDARPAEVAEVLERCWGGPETLVVVSSDLSHFLSYSEASALDRATAEWIVESEVPGLDPYKACGARCIDGLKELGRRRPLRLELLDLRNSGDTTGPRDQVVGYGSFAVYEGDATP